MDLGLDLGLGPTPTPGPTPLPAVLFRRNPLARRYRLYVDRDGQPRVTLPRRGSLREARDLVERHADWLIRQVERVRERAHQRHCWTFGREIFLRGEPHPLTPTMDDSGRPAIQLGPLRIPLRGGKSTAPGATAQAGGTPGDAMNLRPSVEARLRRLAEQELPARVAALAGPLDLEPRQVVVRNQRSRWGSCSARRTISLNWRLVQVPEIVRDYIVVHELMHLREMNHSARYWAHVAAACPDFERHEAWLRTHERLIL